MRRITASLISLALVAIMLAQFTSCEEYVLPAVSVDPDTLCFQAGLDSQVVTVTTNVVTTIKPGDIDWVSVSEEWMDCDCEITVTVQPNESTDSRQAELPVKTECFLKYLTIIQEGAKPDTGTFTSLQ